MYNTKLSTNRNCKQNCRTIQFAILCSVDECLNLTNDTNLLKIRLSDLIYNHWFNAVSHEQKMANSFIAAKKHISIQFLFTRIKQSKKCLVSLILCVKLWPNFIMYVFCCLECDSNEKPCYLNVKTLSF